METWRDCLGEETKKPYWKHLQAFVKEERNKFTIYPPNEMVFNALKMTPLDKVKVVILGQDPYHGERQAHGLCFSVQDGIPFPPSLRNIFKELAADLGVKTPKNGNLTKWAEQGVLLINAVLTLDEGKPDSHKNKGWETFTAKMLETLSKNNPGIVYMLWGNNAKAFEEHIHPDGNLILTTSHPSP